ncbi:ZN142 protein, partial [Atractosteus spatula]|nr:ZN142 protein [Atractosteus spatula]
MESSRSLFLCGQEEEHNPLQCPPKACLLEPAGTALGNSSVQNIDCAIDTALLLEKSGSTTTTEITEVSVETEGLYHCEKCTQNFPDSNLFSSHPCLVPICSRIAEPLTTVEWAETTQSETFKCPQCGEAFPRPSALKKHYRAHRDEPSKPVSCSEPGCGFAAQDRQQYQKHLRSVHSLQLVPCAFRSCRLAFCTLEEMEAHRRGHFPFHCTRCDFVTTNAKQLGEHSRGHKPSNPAVEEEKSDHTEALPVQEMEADPSEAGQDVPEKSTRSLDKITSSNEGEAEKEVEGEGQQSQNKGAAEKEKEPGDMTVPTTDSKDRHFKVQRHTGSLIGFRENWLWCECVFLFPAMDWYPTSRLNPSLHFWRKWRHTDATTSPSTAHTEIVKTGSCSPANLRHIAKGMEHLYRTHICPECRRCFKKRTHLLEHLHLHFPDPSLQCPNCQHYFTSKSKLRIHMQREAGEKLHRCHLCVYSAVERNSLRRHLASVHGEEVEDNFYSDVYPCPTCGKTFRLSQALKAHMKSHHTSSEVQALVCFKEGCLFKSVDKKEFQRHAKDTHGVKAVECRHHACSAFFGTKEDMEAHCRTHLAFHCPQCDFSCSNKSNFQRHKRQGHPGTEELRCNFCPFTSFNPVEFGEHVSRLHANEKIHHCSQCSFVTAHKRVLGRHMLLHTGEKPHKCKLCDFRCRDETYLSKHMLTHSDDKNYMCSECGYVTKWKHYLNVHMRKHAGDLRYQCNQCSYRCHRADQLSSHKLRHQEKSLICEVCAFACKRKYELRKHMRIKHSQEGDYQLPLFQCKYCSYHTHYRQALFNHENCKHTRHREFRCALCSYCTFSSTSLFLHKRKVHGYVPGDKEWLENYAQREKENNTADVQQNGCEKQTISPDPVLNERNIVTPEVPASIERDSNHQMGRYMHASQEKSPNVTQNDCQEVSITDICENQRVIVDEEECCTLVLTHISKKTLVDPKLSSIEGIRAPLCNRLNEAEEDMVLADCEDQSDTEESDVPPKELTGLRESERKEKGGLLSEPKDRAKLEVSQSESVLKALRKQDKDQAEALVLEGRVQMLVVQTKASVFRCDRCSYVTCKQTSLNQHCRSSCRSRKAVLKCRDCGVVFKQQRGLNTHRLRKCPVILKRNSRFLHPRRTGQLVAKKSEEGNLAKGQGIEDSSKALPSEGESISVSTEKQDSALTFLSLPQEIEVSKGYQQEGGKYKCKNCSFTCCRLSTIKRHCTACLNRKNLAEVEEDKAALESHCKRGCLKPNEIQCQLCSFVAKSKEALDRHRLIHGKKTLSSAIEGKRPRLQCKFCAFTCKQIRCLNQHVALKHEGVKPYRCRFCDFSTTRRYRLEAHESLHTGVGRLSCELCSQTFGTNLNDVSRHNLSCHTGELSHACLHCTARFSSETALKQHCHRQHQDPTNLACPQCDFTCHSQATLKSHLLRKHPQLECPTCQVMFETREGLEEHRKTHFTQRCPLCPFAARERQLLVQHLLDEHEEGPPEEKPLKCAACGFSCRHQLVFEQHVRSHGGTRIYKCTDCQYSTRNRQKITWHIRIHTGEKPYHCEQCSYACADPSRLKYHMRTHQEERKYLCPECGYKCKWVNQLKYHMTKHTGAKPYVCEECDYRTNRADALRIHRETRHREVRSFICEKCGKGFKTTHLKKHSEERPYVCRVCQRAFRWPAGLRHHYLTHTKQHPFHCLHCSYRAKQKFQVVKHLQRHHPEQPLEQSIGKDPGPHTVPLQQARLGVLEEHSGAARQESEEVQQEPGEGEGEMGQ